MADAIAKMSIQVSATGAPLNKDMDRMAKDATAKGKQIGKNLARGANAGAGGVGGAAAAVTGTGPSGFRPNMLGPTAGILGVGGVGGFGGLAAMGPAGLIVAAGAAITLFALQSEQAKAAFERLGQSLGRFVEGLSDRLAPAVEGATGVFTEMFDRLNLQAARAGGRGQGLGLATAGEVAVRSWWGTQALEAFTSLVEAENQSALTETERLRSAAQRREAAAREVPGAQGEPVPGAGPRPGLQAALDFRDRIRESANGLNMFAEQAELARLRLQGLQGAGLQVAEAAAREAAALRDAAERQREFDRLAREQVQQQQQVRQFNDANRNAAEVFRDRLEEINRVFNLNRNAQTGAAATRATADAVRTLEQQLGIDREATVQAMARMAPAMQEGAAETASFLNRWRREQSARDAMERETPQERANRILERSQQIEQQQLREAERGVQVMQELLRRAPHLRPANLR